MDYREFLSVIGVPRRIALILHRYGCGQRGGASFDEWIRDIADGKLDTDLLAMRQLGPKSLRVLKQKANKYLILYR